MRVACIFLFLVPITSSAQQTNRYGLPPNAKQFPQRTAKETLASVIKAIEEKQFDYLVAHLADPKFIDDRVKRVYGGKFEEQVQDTQARLDPATVKQLRQFLKEGEWKIDSDQAIATLESIKDRVIRLIKREGQWYLSHPSSSNK